MSTLRNSVDRERRNSERRAKKAARIAAQIAAGLPVSSEARRYLRKSVEMSDDLPAGSHELRPKPAPQKGNTNMIRDTMKPGGFLTTRLGQRSHFTFGYRFPLIGFYLGALLTFSLEANILGVSLVPSKTETMEGTVVRALMLQIGFGFGVFNLGFDVFTGRRDQAKADAMDAYLELARANLVQRRPMNVPSGELKRVDVPGAETVEIGTQKE